MILYVVLIGTVTDHVGKTAVCKMLNASDRSGSLACQPGTPGTTFGPTYQASVWLT